MYCQLCSAFLFLAQTPASAGMPFSFIIADHSSFKAKLKLYFLREIFSDCPRTYCSFPLSPTDVLACALGCLSPPFVPRPFLALCFHSYIHVCLPWPQCCGEWYWTELPSLDSHRQAEGRLVPLMSGTQPRGKLGHCYSLPPLHICFHLLGTSCLEKFLPIL